MDAAHELIADVPPLRNELELKRMAMARLGKQVVELKNVTVRFDGKPAPVLDGVDWIIGPGEPLRQSPAPTAWAKPRF